MHNFIKLISKLSKNLDFEQIKEIDFIGPIYFEKLYKAFIENSLTLENFWTN